MWRTMPGAITSVISWGRYMILTIDSVSVRRTSDGYDSGQNRYQTQSTIQISQHRKGKKSLRLSQSQFHNKEFIPRNEDDQVDHLVSN